MEYQKFEPSHPTEILIAALNEEEGIRATIVELEETLHFQRILVIDGHSSDRTVEAAKDCGAEIVFQDGKGKGDALAKAVKYLGAETKYVIITDADYTYPAGHLPQMLQLLERNPRIGMVCGNRFQDKPEDSASPSRFYYGNKMLAFAHCKLNGVNLEDPLTGLRIVRAEIFRNWVIKSKGFDIEVELNIAVNRLGFETIEVPIGYRERLGEKKLKMKHGISIFKRIVLESLELDSYVNGWVDLFQTGLN